VDVHVGVARTNHRHQLREGLAELQSAVARRADASPLAAGDLVSSGTLTESRAIASGETWSVEVNGIDLKPLTLALD
jgi:hypothetical protein